MVRVATVGTSDIVRRALDAMAAVPGIQHVGAYSRDVAKARELLSGTDGVATNDLRQLADSPAVDAVYLASPNALHAPQTALLLEAGKHVIVEKCATTAAYQFGRLRETARARGVVLMEATRNGAYDPGVSRIAELLPALGRIRVARFEYAQRSSRYDRFLAGHHVNIFDPAMSAGALMDIGVYCAHLAVELFGMPEQILAASMCRLRGGIDGAGLVVAGYDQTIVTLAYSKITDSHVASEIQGEDATLVIDDVPNPRRLLLVDRHGARQQIALDKADNNMVYQFAEFQRLVQSGADVDRWNDVTERRMQLMDTVRARIGLRFPADERPLESSH
ncbi:MAG: Gfo/Idh/MocA family protein [Dermatophilaceae bacterium]